METFKTGQEYGNDLTIKIVKRTAKTVTIESCFGTQRVKVREYQNGVENIYFKAWIITAAEKFDKEEAKEIAYYNAYCK